MTTITATRATVPVPALLRVSLVATVLAAAATEALTAAVRAAGVTLAAGEPGGGPESVVPVDAGACAVSVVLCMIIGTALATLVNRRSSRPARTYRIVTGVLVLVSLAGPLTAAATTVSTRLTLVAAHLLAAAIVVPLVSRRLAGTR